MENQNKNNVLIKSLRKTNIDLFKEINDLETLIKQKKEEINQNNKKIYSLCEHHFERECCYGERTSFKCIICGMDSY